MGTNETLRVYSGLDPLDWPSFPQESLLVSAEKIFHTEPALPPPENALLPPMLSQPSPLHLTLREQWEAAQEISRLLRTLSQPSEENMDVEKHFMTLLKERMERDKQYEALVLSICTWYQRNKVSMERNHLKLKELATQKEEKSKKLQSGLSMFNNLSFVLAAFLFGSLLFSPAATGAFAALSGAAAISAGSVTLLQTATEHDANTLSAARITSEGMNTLLHELYNEWISTFEASEQQIIRDADTLKMFLYTQQEKKGMFS